MVNGGKWTCRSPIYWPLKALYKTCHIHPFTHIHTPMAEAAMQFGVQYLAQRYLVMQLSSDRGSRIRTSDLPITGGGSWYDDFSLPYFNRVKKRADIIGAFKFEPLYLKHENQESGRVISLQLFESSSDNKNTTMTTCDLVYCSHCVEATSEPKCTLFWFNNNCWSIALTS